MEGCSEERQKDTDKENRRDDILKAKEPRKRSHLTLHGKGRVSTLKTLSAG